MKENIGGDMKRILQKIRPFYSFCMALCMAASLNAGQAPVASKPEKIWVNVFIHGIISIKPHISWANFMRFMKDKVEGTHYEKTVELMRKDPYFYKNQAMQEVGLQPVCRQLYKGNSSGTLAYSLDEIADHYGVLKKPNCYYTFGWSGLLSSKSRYQDSLALLIALEKKVQKLRAKGFDPRIRIYGYSHGGNVALNLAAVAQDQNVSPTFKVNELILIGSPIISETDYLVREPIFKRVYNLYSMRDRIQPMDVFTPRQFFSNRVFKPRKSFELPEKLTQIQLKVSRCAHNACEIPRRYARSLDFTQKDVVYGNKKLMRDTSPGHVELWFFGWTPMSYRQNFPLNPLPTVAFAPIVTHHAKKMKDEISPETPLVADIRPQHKLIVFRKNNRSDIHSTVPYISNEKLSEMHRAIRACKPPLYSCKIYNSHVKDAVEQAKHMIKTKRAR